MKKEPTMSEDAAPILGLWYEEFSLDEVRVSQGRTIGEVDLTIFSGLTGDHGQVHTNEEYCRKGEFGTRIAHGLLGLSIANGLICLTNNVMHGTAVASLGWDKWRFMRPIKIGDTVHVRWRLIDKRESKSRPDMGVITDYIELVNQRGEVVQAGEHVTLVRKKPKH